MQTNRRVFDVDIDVQSNCDRTKYGTRAMVYNEEASKILPHPSGVYLEKIPVDSFTGNAAISHKDGDFYGFYKVDLLTNTTYDAFLSKEDLLSALEKEPDWSLLQKPRVVEKLPHVGRHFDMLQEITPTDVESLADFLALIRPGKIHLIEDYKKNPTHIRPKLYQRPKNGVFFKKSHAISYALMIVATLNKVHDSGIVW